MDVVKTAMRLGKSNFILLDYKLPEYLQGAEINAGCRVLARVKSKLCEGLVISTKQQTGEQELKPVEEVIDSNPVIDRELIDLIYWMSDYYLIPFDRAVGVIFPPYTRGKWIYKYERQASKDRILSLAQFFPEEKDVLGYISGKEVFKEATLKGKFGKARTDEILSRLQQGGYITKTVEFKYNVKKQKRNSYVELLLQTDKELSEFLLRNKNAPKQIKIVEYLAEHGGCLSVKDILENVGTTYGTLKQLEKKSVVEMKVAGSDDIFDISEKISAEFELSGEQQECLNVLKKAVGREEHYTYFLHGMTGSGKTEVYLRTAKAVIEQGRQVVVIVPEIALASLIVDYFKDFFQDSVLVLHSRLSEGEKFEAWKRIAKGQVSLVVGTRSAVFSPFRDIGLIIIDEEHERTLKQDTVPRYHTREVAKKRCELNNALLVLGSATPSMETYYLTLQKIFSYLSMKQRVGEGSFPAVKIVDMREELRSGNTSVISRELRQKIEERLSKKEQVIVFLNRRGYASFVNCRDCGYVFKCRYCDVSLKYHYHSGHLKCHYCNYMIRMPEKCTSCSSPNIRDFGLGTERLESIMKKKFPSAKILRMDTDTTELKGAHQKFFEAVSRGDCDILVGTQMVSKGLHFPNVTLVCVIAADMDLNLPDFRAEERTFQLIAQAAGRAGRGPKEGEVIIQTYNPQNPSLVFLKEYNHEEFYCKELDRRRELNYPPYSHLIRVIFSCSEESSALELASKIAGELSAVNIDYMGPAPAPIQRIKDHYRWHLIVKCGGEESVKKTLYDIVHKEKKVYDKVRTAIDVDPLNLL